MAAVHPLKGVRQHEVSKRLYPTWNHGEGLLHGLIIIHVDQIKNVAAVLHESHNNTIKHLVPPREPIWDYTLLPEVELETIITPFLSLTL
jgi:hypothetical protein